jgi:hypothetical protein
VWFFGLMGRGLYSSPTISTMQGALVLQIGNNYIEDAQIKKNVIVAMAAK